MFGGKFTTRPIQDNHPACKITTGPVPCREVQYALMDLPNFAIPEVEVDAVKSVVKGTTTTSLYSVQFTDSSNSGKQNTLQCETVTDSNVNGAQPKYDSVAACKVFNVGGPEWFDNSGEPVKLDLATQGFPEVTTKYAQTDILPGSTADAKTTYEDFQPCASKGDCDGATGTCTCNSGHYGEACEKQSTYY